MKVDPKLRKKYDVRGPDAEALMNRVLVRDVSRCRVGQVFYTAWCDDRGKVIDDGTVARLREDHFRMTAAIPNLYWLQDNACGLDVEIEDVSDAFAAVALQGPTSRDLLQKLASADLGALRFFHCTQSDVAGVDVLTMFDQYYEQSEQRPARFFEITDEQFAMVLALPEAQAPLALLPVGTPR